jgi:hypothetical protein
VRLTARLEVLEMWGKMLGVRLRDGDVGDALELERCWVWLELERCWVWLEGKDVGYGSSWKDVEKKAILYINLEDNYLLLEP